MTVRFIQVGVGVRGSHWATVIRAEPRATTVAYVDLRLDIARQKAIAWNQAHIPCFSTLSEALTSIKADAVLLVTPPAGHFQQVLTAFEAGCHVLCEKPLVEDLGEGVELVKQAGERGLNLMVGMNFRYLPSSQAFRRYIRERRFGIPSYGHFTYLRNRDGRRADLNDFPLTMKQPMLMEQSIHHLDLMRYCYQAEVETLTADTWRPNGSTYVDDCCVSALLQFQGGLRVNYIGTWTAGWNQFTFEWRTDFPAGALIQKAQFGDLFQVTQQPHLATEGKLYKTASEAELLQPIPLETSTDFIDDTKGLLNEFVTALKPSAAAVAPSPLETSGKDHLKTLALVFACIEAAETRQWIDMQDFYERYGIENE